ncbi:MAG: CvpA family protein [Rhodobacteraceae bacterium]|nr:CvpA family protein [Paracoccaceae bacterium]
MQAFTIVDGVVAIVIVLSAILAYSRGFVREVLAIAGWVVAAVLAYTFAHQAEPLMKEIPVVGEFLKGSCELSIIAAFTAVFAVGLIVMSFFTPLFASVVRQSAVGGVDQGLGFLFGVARGVLLVAVAFLVYQRTMGAEAVPMVAKSRSASVFAQFEAQINKQIPSDAPNWVVAKYEHLVGDCGAPAAGGVKSATTPPAGSTAPAATGTTGTVSN